MTDSETRPSDSASEGALDVRYIDMCRAIAECYRVDEVKQIRDKALALEVYSKQARNTDAERRAADIRLRAERRAGVLLEELAAAQMRETRGGNRGNQHTVGKVVGNDIAAPPLLAEFGITRDQSSKWQQLARIPEAEFDAALRDPDRKPSTAALIREIRDPIAARVQRLPDDALWLWGRLCDFERDGFTSKRPRGVLDSMTEAMQADVQRIAPLAIAFLSAMTGESDDEV